MNIAFIGFGGAGYGISRGLRQAGVRNIFFFDKHQDTPPYSTGIREHAAETGAVMQPSINALASSSDLIISCVTGTEARSTAEACAPFLKESHLYVDVNTASPRTKEAVAAVVAQTKALFVDAAMMGAIPIFLHKVPILASGAGAQRFKTIMQPYEMDITCVGELPGQASAIKMFRSIFMKGLLALLLEMLAATHVYQVNETVLASIAATMEKLPFRDTVRLQLTKGAVNAERMTHEMEAVIETLEDLQLPAVMSRTTMEKLKWFGELGMRERFGGNLPQTMDEVLDIVSAGLLNTNISDRET